MGNINLFIDMPDGDAYLRCVRLTPSQFRIKALNCGWKPYVIDALLKEPLPKDYVVVGDENSASRAKVLIVAPDPKGE